MTDLSRRGFIAGLAAAALAASMPAPLVEAAPLSAGELASRALDPLTREIVKLRASGMSVSCIAAHLAIPSRNQVIAKLMKADLVAVQFHLGDRPLPTRLLREQW